MAKQNWSRHVIAFVLIFALSGIMFVRGGCPGQAQRGRNNIPDDAEIETIKVAGWPLRVEIADTAELHRRGWRGRDELAPGHGILFVFQSPAKPAFTSEETHVEVSLAFISEGGVIEEIRDMEPEDFRHASPQSPAGYVLGVRRGFFEDHGISAGEKVELP